MIKYILTFKLHSKSIEIPGIEVGTEKQNVLHPEPEKLVEYDVPMRRFWLLAGRISFYSRLSRLL